jgi:hypothetical protein
MPVKRGQCISVKDCVDGLLKKATSQITSGGDEHEIILFFMKILLLPFITRNALLWFHYYSLKYVKT